MESAPDVANGNGDEIGCRIESSSSIDESELLAKLGMVIEKCTGPACKKNNSKNLTCSCTLGERKWFAQSRDKVEKVLNNKLNKISKEEQSKLKKAQASRQPIGLVNLGATCYVNSFLQIWFHNLPFRKVVLETVVDEGDKPLYQTHHLLRHIFAQLQAGKQQVVNPTPLIDFLELSHNIQQDALEFSKLVINLFESNPRFKAFMHEELFGSCRYKIKCLKCAHANVRENEFSEFNLHPGNKTKKKQAHLRDLIKDYLTEERLVGDNQYFCSQCCRKEDAIRYMELTRLPNTITFHLLRFMYDKELQQRRKINVSVTYPHTIDMRPFMSGDCCEGEKSVYALTAVMLHRGKSASSGHFIVHHRNTTSLNPTDDSWWVLNDDKVSKLKTRGTSGSEEEEDEDYKCEQQAKRRRKSAAACDENESSSSEDAYMLMYTKVDKLKESRGRKCVIPVEVMELVRAGDAEHEREQEEAEEGRKAEAKQERDRKVRRIDFINICNSAPVRRVDARTSWAPTSLIRDFLNMRESQDSLQPLRCPHGKLSPADLHAYKLLPRAAADLLYDVTEGRRLEGRGAVCEACCRSHFEIERRKKELEGDAKLVEELLKDDQKGGGGFLVAASVMKRWRQLALKRIESGKDDDDDEQRFNSELLCKHGNLSSSVTRVHVGPNVWRVVSKYFARLVEVAHGTMDEACPECASVRDQRETYLEHQRALALKYKSNLKNLLTGRDRPDSYFVKSSELDRYCTSPFYLVPRRFLTKLRAFVNAPSRFVDKQDVREELQVRNAVFVCDKHRMYLVDPLRLLDRNNNSNSNNRNDVTTDEIAPPCSLLWSSEWRFVKQHFPYDMELMLRKPEARDARDCTVLVEKVGSTSSSEEVREVEEGPAAAAAMCPRVCESCVREKRGDALRRSLVYDDAQLLVRLSRDTHEEVMEKIRASFNQPPSTTTTTPNGKTRRKRAGKDEKIIARLSSKHTLKDVKIRIFQHFNVPPFDQHIFLNGQFRLDDDDSSLEALGVARDAFLLVCQDRPLLVGGDVTLDRHHVDASEEEISKIIEQQMMSVDEVAGREELADAGFRGTGLLSSSFTS